MATGGARPKKGESSYMLEGGHSEPAEGKQKAEAFTGPTIEDPPQRTKRGFSLLKERARTLAAQAKYYEATTILEDVPDEEKIQLGMKLLIAECYLQLGRENKANTALRALRRKLLDNPRPDIDDMVALIEDLIASSSFTRALVLLPVVSEMYKDLDDPDDRVDGLFRCLNKADDCARPMIKAGERSRVLAIDFGIEYMTELLEDIHDCDEADADKRVLKEAFSTKLIAFAYYQINENMKGVKLREKGVKGMENHFGKQHASQFKIYGQMLYEIGVGYALLNKQAKSKAAFEASAAALDKASDFDGENEKQMEVRRSKQKLRDLEK